MEPPLDPASRPSRLAWLTQCIVALLLLGSFLSGVLWWWGQTIQEREMQSPGWLQAVRVTHGVLYPFLCGLFGYLACVHIRLGWSLRANLLTGIPLEALFLALILTGLGLLYAGSEEWRTRLVWTHRVVGLLLPLALGGHWVTGLRHGKKVSK